MPSPPPMYPDTEKRPSADRLLPLSNPGSIPDTDTDTDTGAMLSPALRRRQRPLTAVFFIALVLLGFWHLQPMAAPAARLAALKDAYHQNANVAANGAVAVASPAVADKKVPLEIHIMSKCPDAEMCLSDMILPAMMRVSDKVDFKLSFIGALSEDDGGVLCKHGPTECMGNIIELCAFELYPDPKIALGFTMCITRDFPHIPERSLVQDCALEHGMDFNALNECANREDGAHGISMLRRSVTETSQAGVTKSCTVRVNNQVYCIADDGAWKNCPKGSSVDTLVKTIEDLASST